MKNALFPNRNDPPFVENSVKTVENLAVRPSCAVVENFPAFPDRLLQSVKPSFCQSARSQAAFLEKPLAFSGKMWYHKSVIWIHRNVTEHYEKLDVNGRNGLWAIIALGNGKYRLVSKSNGYYVDLANGICENGHNICMVRYIEGEAQEWEFIPCEEPKPDILLGDLYKDDKLSIMDIIVLQRHLVNLDTISEAQSTLADMNSDGTVDIFDLALLKHAVLS